MVDLEAAFDAEASLAVAEQLATAPVEVREWRTLRRAVLAAGGISARSFGCDPEDIPGGLYRRGGASAGEVLFHLHDETHEDRWAVLLATDSNPVGEVLALLRSSFERYQAASARLARARERVPAGPSATVLRDGRRRLADHLARLETRWGDRLDLELLQSTEYADAYETGERIVVDGKRGTVGCTGGQRPQFVLMVSYPL